MSSFNIIPATTIYSKVLQSRSLNIVTNLFTVQLLITLHLSPTIKTVTICVVVYSVVLLEVLHWLSTLSSSRIPNINKQFNPW